MKYSARNKTWTDVKRIERLSIKLDPVPDLRSCPNCRSLEIIDVLYSVCHGNWRIACGCGQDTKRYRSLKRAITYWNRRAAEAMTV